MNIFIQTTTRDAAWGGGNQFLKALRSELEKKGLYTPLKKEATVVIYNSYQDLGALLRDFLFGRRVVRVYRLGPIFSLHRRGLKWWLIDIAMAIVGSMCASVVIMQSEWSLEQMRRKGFFKKKNVHVTHNAVDPKIFQKQSKNTISPPIRLIYTSWSNNPNKGFEYLTFLDQHFDFKKYSLTFVGNTPISFTHIKVLPPVASNGVAAILADSDIFITPTKDDACSNAIIEALTVGLPVVALDSGANRELVGTGGELFYNTQSLLDAIDRVARSREEYSGRIVVQTIDTVADAYVAAIHASIT